MSLSSSIFYLLKGDHSVKGFWVLGVYSCSVGSLGAIVHQVSNGA